MPEGKTLAIVFLSIGLVIASAGFTNYYLQSSLSNQKISFLEQDPSAIASTSTVTSTKISVVPITESTTDYTVTNTTTSTLISTSFQTVSTTSISSTTFSTTYTTSTTTTQTTSIFPPSNSTYSLTFVSGNATQSQAQVQCGYLVLNVYVTYEIHQEIPSNIVQWARNPSGSLMQPSDQKEFTNQAYLTIYSSYNYGTGFCPNDGSISNATIFVTDSNNNQLSTETVFALQSA